MTAAIIGASSDIRSQLVCYLVQAGNIQVICSVQHAALHKFKRQTNLNDADLTVQVRILTGNMLDLANLQTMI
jgi:hypothetical protein